MQKTDIESVYWKHSWSLTNNETCCCFSLSPRDQTHVTTSLFCTWTPTYNQTRPQWHLYRFFYMLFFSVCASYFSPDFRGDWIHYAILWHLFSRIVQVQLRISAHHQSTYTLDVACLTANLHVTKRRLTVLFPEGYCLCVGELEWPYEVLLWEDCGTL